MDNMIYDFKTHSLYYDNKNTNTTNFSLAIDTLELVFELQTGRI